MNPKVNNLLCLSAAVLLGLTSALAQTPGDALSTSNVSFPYATARKWYAGALVGATTFHGDMGKLKPGFHGGIVVGHDFGTVVGLRVHGAFGTLAGSNNNNGSFTGTVIDASLQGVFTLGNQSFFRKARRLNYYGLAGLGITNYNATSTGVDSSQVFSPYTGDASGLVMNVNLGFGLRYALTRAIDINLETGFRYAFADDIDAYYPLLKFPNRSRDAYMLHSIGVVYNFGKDKESMSRRWINPIGAMYEDIADNKKKIQMLTKDGDNDGVADYFDKDPSTPDSVAVYGNGKAVDTDMDGVPDYKDKEPFSDKGAAVDADGKMADADMDGVPDVRDISPNTDTSLVVNFQGVPFMTKDLARKMAAKKGASMDAIPVMPIVFFETNSAEVKASSYSALYEVAEIMKLNPDLKIKIIGNTDETSTDKYNQKLGMRRAESVKTKLVNWFGVDASRITTESQGEKVPLVKGRGYDANTANRRVQFFIYEGN